MKCLWCALAMYLVCEKGVFFCLKVKIIVIYLFFRSGNEETNTVSKPMLLTLENVCQLAVRLCYIEDKGMRNVHWGCVASTKTGLTLLELQQPKPFPLHKRHADSSSNLNFSRLQVHAYLGSLSWIVSLYWIPVCPAEGKGAVRCGHIIPGYFRGFPQQLVLQRKCLL